MLTKARDVLTKFNQGYIDRDVDAIDSFTEALFINAPDTVILGTSNGELCLGFEACKKLIEADWKGWGDVRFDVDNAVFQSYPNMTWFAVRGTLQLSFTQTDEKFAGFVDFVKEALATAETSPQEGLGLINWGLAQFSFAREGLERNYLWPVTLTGALVPDQGQLKFKYMQFSVPCSTYPDQRVGTPALDRLHQGKPFNTAHIMRPLLHTDALRAVAQFQSSMPKFNPSVVPLVIDPKNNWYQGASAEQGITTIREQWGQLELDVENALVQTVGDTTYVVSGGVMIKHVAPDDLLRERMQAVRVMADSQLPPREKLFNIQRDIAATLKEVASGPDHRWPCRVEAVYSHMNDQWLLNSMQLSFPYYWIFEGKIDGQLL